MGRGEVVPWAVGSALLHLLSGPACPGGPHSTPGIRSGVSQWVHYSGACVCEVQGQAGRPKQTEESHWDRPLDTGAPQGSPKHVGVFTITIPHFLESHV